MGTWSGNRGTGLRNKGNIGTGTHFSPPLPFPVYGRPKTWITGVLLNGIRAESRTKRCLASQVFRELALLRVDSDCRCEPDTVFHHPESARRGFLQIAPAVFPQVLQHCARCGRRRAAHHTTGACWASQQLGALLAETEAPSPRSQV